MKNMLKYMAVALLMAVAFSACKKDPEPEPQPGPVAGKGGNATIRATIKHHSWYVDSCKVYIKYNAVDKAASYDDSTWAVLSADSIPIATFSGLKTGNYFLFGDGWDPVIAMDVEGGMGLKITEEKPWDVTLYVTEGD